MEVSRLHTHNNIIVRIIIIDRLCIGIQAEAIDQVLVFPPNISSICINFNITDDTIALEPPEEFTLELLKPDDPQLLLLLLQINSTRIIIVDDDGMLNNTGMLILLLSLHHGKHSYRYDYYLKAQQMISEAQINDLIT
jgi:hypothetical protein